MHSQKRTKFFDTKVKRIVSRDTKLEHHGRPWRKSDLKQCISFIFFSFIGIIVYNSFFRIVSDFSMRTILSHIPIRKYLSFLKISRFLSVFLIRFFKLYRYRNFQFAIIEVSNFLLRATRFLGTSHHASSNIFFIFGHVSRFTMRSCFLSYIPMHFQKRIEFCDAKL